MVDNKQKHPSDSEWKVLKVVWLLGLASIRELYEEFLKREGWALSTVKTLARRLHAKGHLVKETRQGVTVYRATKSAKSMLLGSVDELVRDVKKGTLGPLIVHLVKRSSLSNEELQGLRRLIQEEEVKRRGGSDD